MRSALESLLRRGISLRRPVGTFEADDEAGDEDEADGDLQLDLSDAEER